MRAFWTVNFVCIQNEIWHESYLCLDLYSTLFSISWLTLFLEVLFYATLLIKNCTFHGCVVMFLPPLNMFLRIWIHGYIIHVFVFKLKIKNALIIIYRITNIVPTSKYITYLHPKDCLESCPGNSNDRTGLINLN